MKVSDRIYRKLNNTFYRQDALKIIVGAGYSVSYTDNVLEGYIHSGKAVRVKRGKYKKTEA